ncbi:MAG: type IV toxin-antitoxin system AbiEi family antitoxin domain-containing protein [Sphaerochaetaceae bacterium]|nr:type IV toxin-antitoxin system AbiEi family antitoxin domain-containing protein [Sphaerochaetaceae bacterium]
MQPIKRLEEILRTYSDEEHFLYAADTLKPFFTDMQESAYLKLLSRAVKSGLLERVCKGVYLYPRVRYDASTVLFRTARILREDRFLYLSLESVLSHYSIISQQLMNCITVMTNGREGVVSCGDYGLIEFTHFNRLPNKISARLFYNSDIGMLEAYPDLALRDMVSCRRSLDLVDMEEYEEVMGEIEDANA